MVRRVPCRCLISWRHGNRTIVQCCRSQSAVTIPHTECDCNCRLNSSFVRSGISWPQVCAAGRQKRWRFANAGHESGRTRHNPASPPSKHCSEHVSLAHSALMLGRQRMHQLPQNAPPNQGQKHSNINVINALSRAP